ncbi:hypothetical protein HMPREF1624_02279 [Sporothrix schenckii ATCC 58251]|uniref:Uncharacterized protein n=1 Tax=Sporothrix schenckii (strain ATCC 58251 / de Perez 2211183) TaxID=1391915 RepID=U7Q1J5_SPOS1|nr:hypothetical protein HMPREF1624_02279 [Sporothrix schenckii ATCC 58251]
MAATVASRQAIVPTLVDNNEKAAAALVQALETEPTPSPPPSPSPASAETDSSRFITFSPYPDHLLDLETLDPQTALLARALSVFDKTRDDYATAPYVQSFNFSVVIDELRRLRASTTSAATPWEKRDYFVVAFRSQIPPTTNYGDLSSLDKAAHREATDSGGLLRYWFHLPDADGRNLATCLWRSPADAHKAGHGAQHRKASSSVRSLYREWRIERYRLVIDDDVKSWEVIEWRD